MKDWKKKMLMKVTTIRAKIMASTHSARADGFLPSLLRGFQKVQLTFFVTVISKTTIRPNSHHHPLSQITHAT